jgi:hypothetical protein
MPRQCTCSSSPLTCRRQGRHRRRGRDRGWRGWAGRRVAGEGAGRYGADETVACVAGVARPAVRAGRRAGLVVAAGVLLAGSAAAQVAAPVPMPWKAGAQAGRGPASTRAAPRQGRQALQAGNAATAHTCRTTDRPRPGRSRSRAAQSTPAAATLNGHSPLASWGRWPAAAGCRCPPLAGKGRWTLAFSPPSSSTLAACPGRGSTSQP